MTEAKRHINNARVTIQEDSERSFVNDTLQGLLDEIDRLDSEAQELADTLAGIIPGETCGEAWGNPDDDGSTYFISFGNMRRARPLLKARKTAQHG